MPFVPLGAWGPQGGSEMALKCHETGFLALGGSGGSKWMDLSVSCLGYTQDGLLVPFGPIWQHKIDMKDFLRAKMSQIVGKMSKF